VVEKKGWDIDTGRADIIATWSKTTLCFVFVPFSRRKVKRIIPVNHKGREKLHVWKHTTYLRVSVAYVHFFLRFQDSDVINEVQSLAISAYR
jgi:hypothetical protein